MKFNQTDRTFLLLLTLFSVCILFSWFYRGNLFIGAEEGIIFQRIDYVYSKMVTSVWLDLYLGVPYFSDLSKRPLYGFLVYLYYFGASAFFLQVSIIGGILFGSVVSTYLLFRNTFKIIPYARLAAFAGAFFYLSNPYVISHVWGRGLYPQFFAYIYYPLFILFINYYFDRKQIIFLCLNLIISFVLSAAMGNPSYFVSLWVLVFCFWLYKSTERRLNYLELTNQLIVLVTFFVGWVAINSWWLVVTGIFAPAAFLGPGSVFENSLESLRAISSQYSFSSLIRLYHPLHFESNLYFGIYRTYFFQFASWIGLFITLFSIKYIRIKSVLFYVCLLIIGLIICLGSNQPFGSIFEWIFSHFSPLQVFRNPYEKFGLVYLLAYSALFGVGTVAFYLILRKFHHFLGVLLIICTLFLGVGGFNWPLWTGDVISWGNKSGIPDRYQIFDDWQKQNKNDQSRILFTPFLSSFGSSYNWINADYHGNDPLYQLIDASVLTQTGSSQYLDALKQYTGSKNLDAVLDRIGVSLIVDRPDVVSTQQDKKSKMFLTKYFQQPTDSFVTICLPDTIASENHYLCEVSPSKQDLSKYLIIQVKFKSDEAGFVNVLLTDRKNSRPRWSGLKDKTMQYQIEDIGKYKSVFIYLMNPVENPDTDLTSIKQIEVNFFPLKSDLQSNFQVHSIDAVVGNQVLLTNYNYINNIKGLEVYQSEKKKKFGYIKTYSQVKYSDSYKNMFDDFSKSDDTAYLLDSQNVYVPSITTHSYQSEINYSSISDTEYIIDIKKQGEYFISLNQNFNPEWKFVISDLDSLSELNFLKRVSLFFEDNEENNQFVVDGFSNGWYLKSDKPVKAVIFYKPQLLLSILWPISVVVVCSLGLFIAIRMYRNSN
jgi:hypothetical protein